MSNMFLPDMHRSIRKSRNLAVLTEELARYGMLLLLCDCDTGDESETSGTNKQDGARLCT